MRMRSVVEAFGVGAVHAVCDTSSERLDALAAELPDVRAHETVESLLEEAADLDAVVIATPNALHASQTVAALERELAVFCQKPLGISAAETERMVDAARRADRRLGVDYSYRHTDAARALKELVRRGELGRVFSVDAVFHNAYGPDKAWCRDPDLAGGGAFMDLGVHLLDLALWLLDFPEVREVQGTLFRAGERLDGRGIDDFAKASVRLGGAAGTIAASWNAHAGADCEVRVSLFGTDAGAEMRNIDGSFYDFTAARHDGRERTELTREGDAWLGRGIVEWCGSLASSARFDPEIEHSIAVAQAVDAVYGR